MSDIFDKVNHRPWSLPKGPAVISQECHDLLFAHWPVSIDFLRQTVPFSLPIDTFDGRPWIGITFFRTARARLRGLPPIPWLSAFLALNVRTYVTMDGKPGVYFLSLDTSNRLVAAVARWTSPLPYFHARMSLTQVGDSLHCSSRRRRDGDAPAEFVGAYRAVGPIVYPERESPGLLADRTVLSLCGASESPHLSNRDSPLAMASSTGRGGGPQQHDAPLARP